MACGSIGIPPAVRRAATAALTAPPVGDQLLVGPRASLSSEPVFGFLPAGDRRRIDPSDDRGLPSSSSDDALLAARRDALSMRIGSSLFLVAIGAILYFAVTATFAGIDIQTVGLIFMVIGVIGFALTLILARRTSGPERRRDYY